jgi:hypothetical protein
MSYFFGRSPLNPNHQEGKGNSALPESWLNSFYPEGYECPRCRSKDVELTFTDHRFSYMSGDDYYSWEFFCKDCKSYTTDGYSD